MEGLEEFGEIGRITSLCNICIEKKRIDEKIYHFLFIIKQIKKIIYDHIRIKKDGKFVGLEEIENGFTKDMVKMNFKKELDLFYKLFETDEGRVLLDFRDWKKRDNDIYDFERYEEVYNYINKNNILISEILGQLINRIIGGDEDKKEY